ncbi:unnamed protein product [Spirodela intermedia]|uniref:Bifunctional inhibitor/plant lipid transfer protein/seed storage helical domain-containing protein n=2 Tax=Spirodela intermedia TaxID=51605 RepID=A0A7I8KG60_SPIIN|nr:unnamed protein product [Spirodela intermedia]CAA6659845.1 unnamed protein product [Spirodela intermedia]CAA7396164.1 unnamed protein product [Spirodela intermedia]
MGFTAKLVVAALAAWLALSVAGGADICNVTWDELQECQPAAMPPKPPPPPTRACCAAVEKADLKCLCSYSKLLPDFGVDPELAMKLPKKCGLGEVNC